jgi:hypothetical protein
MLRSLNLEQHLLNSNLANMLKGVPPWSLPNRPIEKQIIRLLCRRINSQNKSLLHLPPEVLQIIFEFAVEHNQRGFKCATRISQVSQKMRRIAISTPRLWSYIQCCMGKSESSILEFWDRTSQRVKNVPVDILIRNIGCRNACHLGICRMDQIASINSLALESQYSECIEELSSPSFTPPTTSLNHLSLRASCSVVSHEWDIAILTRFPPIARLSLYGIHISCNHHISFPSIQELSLSDMEMDLAPILTHLHNLTFLEIGHIMGLKPQPIPFVLPNLRTLKARRANWWIDQLKCPSITTFIIDFLLSDADEVLLWISRHPTITRLESWRIDDYERLTNACPQLEHLVIRIQAHRFRPEYIQMPKFPALKTFALHDGIGCLSPEVFEQVVCSRCLPTSHAKSELATGERELERLELLFCSKKKWRQKSLDGTLYQEARKTSRMLDIEEVQRLGLVYVDDEWLQINLSWV